MGKLFLSETDEVLAGVCGGIGDWMRIEPDLLRILFLVAGLYYGAGALLYIALAMLIPFHPEEAHNDFFERYDIKS